MQNPEHYIGNNDCVFHLCIFAIDFVCVNISRNISLNEIFLYGY